MTKGPIPQHKRAHRIGGWLPRDKTIIRDYVNGLVTRANEKDNQVEWIPVVKSLASLIYNNPIVYMLFTEMLTEVPFHQDPSHQPEIKDVPTLLNTINHQIQAPIRYNDSVQIGTPINAILDWPMGTKAGFAAFLRDDVNACFEAILKHWGEYLQSHASICTVTTETDGWLSAAAQDDPESPGLKDFLNTYVVPNPEDKHYGYDSWDKFFTRKFLDGLRPVSYPDDPSVIVSAAESTPFAIQHDVQRYDSFWAKDQHYSLDHLLGDPKMAEKFYGGTVYQAFLSADSYHNWHAPVSGKYLDKPHIIPGTYYSEPLLWGFDPDHTDKVKPDPDPGADAKSQGYISCVAKRGVAYIQPDDPSLGLIAIVMIGMAEVSSIEFDDLAHFKKGDEIGRFHFGGSTHCLIFQPGYQFMPIYQAMPSLPEYRDDQPPVPVCSRIGTLKPKTDD